TFLLRALKGRGNVRDIFARNRRAGQSDFPSVPPPLPTSKKNAPVTLPLASAQSVGAFSTSLLASRRKFSAARAPKKQKARSDVNRNGPMFVYCSLIFGRNLSEPARSFEKIEPPIPMRCHGNRACPDA